MSPDPAVRALAAVPIDGRCGRRVRQSRSGAPTGAARQRRVGASAADGHPVGSAPFAQERLPLSFARTTTGRVVGARMGLSTGRSVLSAERGSGPAEIGLDGPQCPGFAAHRKPLATSHRPPTAPFFHAADLPFDRFDRASRYARD